MTPSVDERLASVVRALNDVILPSLPADAGLAKEQVQLCVGHIQILRTQIDAGHAFEAGELNDAVTMAKALTDAISGGALTGRASATLDDCLAKASQADDPAAIREARVAIHAAIKTLVGAVNADGSEASRSSVSRIIVEHETRRVAKDRVWFAPFGFDSIAA